MRFQILSTLALVATGVVADRWANMDDLPDGPYSGITHANGSTTMTSLDTNEVFNFVLIKEDEKRSQSNLKKRFAACWGTHLDHRGVDEAVVALKNWAGKGGKSLVSGDHKAYFGYNRRGVYVYYCIDRPHREGNLDINDINHALWEMDHTCRAYEAGYYQWDSTPEIVGKCTSGTAVCVGHD